MPHIIYTSMSTDWKITPESLSMFLEANNLSKNKLIILNNPDNPTGTSYSESELRELSKIFRENNILVLSDEIYARLRFDQGHCTIAKVYPEGTILSSGLSKWASAGGWRLGYHIYPPGLSELREAVRSGASHTYTCAAAPIQYASVKMLKDVAGCHDYILHTTRIMGVVSDFCYRELTSIGVKALKPTAGYYIFPDFAILRMKLRQYGIDTCEQMCEAMLEECSVSVMAGGPAFLRPLDELTVRLCFVNFDGTKALCESRKNGLQTKLQDNFILEHCRPVYEGIQALKSWVLKKLES